MVGFLGYSPAGMERLRALVTEASERCAIFSNGIDAVRLPDGIIAPDVGVQAAAAFAGTRQGLGYLAALTTACHPIPAIAVRALPLALDPVVALVANVDTAPAAAAAAIATATTVSIVRILVDRPEVRARVGLAAVPTARWTSLADALKRADAADDVDQRDRALADVDRVIDNDLHLSTYVARVTTTASLTWG